MSGANEISKKGKIVIQYLEDYPDMPSLTLARMIYFDHPMEFTSVQNARSIIKFHRGKSGDRNRRVLKNKKYVKHERGSYAPYAMPKSEVTERKVIRLKGKKIGLMSDVHMPNHIEKAVDKCVQAFVEQKVDTIVINGDLLDNTPFSRHAPINYKPTPLDVTSWFDKGELFLEWLRDIFPKAEIIWLEGNHDKWYQRFLLQKGGELSADKYFSLQERMHLSEYKIRYVDESILVKAGDLNIHHGHLIVKGVYSPVNPAKGASNKTKKPIIIGHLHQTSEHTEVDIDGNEITCFSLGCLCTLHPDYQPIGGKSNHGYAIVDVYDDGTFSVDNRRITKKDLL
jgi:predicted phosphodiesterase